VEKMFADPEWAKWSDGRIAEHCGVSQQFVNKLRVETTHNRCESTARVGKDGRTIDTTNLGRRSEPAVATIPLPALVPGKAYCWYSWAEVSPEPVAVTLELAPMDDPNYWRYAETFEFEPVPGQLEGWQDLCVRGIRLRNAWQFITRHYREPGHWEEMEPTDLLTQDIVGERAQRLRAELRSAGASRGPTARPGAIRTRLASGDERVSRRDRQPSLACPSASGAFRQLSRGHAAGRAVVAVRCREWGCWMSLA